ncbi:glutathione S-transferase C-terminal domain-containing protein-like [Biomphalaria glabrata]|uniref:Glutathione S-transferase C-terminal domain-containing protein-like n=1 Tax=Biomphalaria glabrata TaxID=6526 RepID=A0A9W3B0X8_BIOGL|nr:glutathione S-transferase C-terminal domain-containing protein-like [Biomphalaria glabrata]XP_055893133.1 glutathione S-transferase C-terminal domain-containing protein-like [Biomphalaria glabrata]XP_055893134.1 glutathione S-transferase C-terminal domain-containing protein-like [Biomphalaria glabrata]XP_055893135.1 glutathione S-transferase C-terminal domain-containing protein-like [Biomphalaria glabrata]
MKAKIYLHGDESADGSTLHCSLSSTVIIFLIRYCQTHQFELVFVTDRNSSNCCSLKLKCLTDLKIQFSPWSDVPSLVQNVQLPSLYQPHMSLVRSGLCVLLRHIVQEADKTFPELKLIDVLGFREGSMKMCAEVSGWTKLCEVDLAQSILELINSTKDAKDLKNQKLPLSCHFLKLESHFHKKCRVHNDNRQRRAELNRIKKSLIQCIKKGLNLKRLENEFYSCEDCTALSPVNKTIGNRISDEVNDRTNAEFNDRTDAETNDTQRGFNVNNSNFLPHLAKVALKVTTDNSGVILEQAVHLKHGIRRVRIKKQLGDIRAVKKEKKISDRASCNLSDGKDCKDIQIQHHNGDTENSCFDLTSDICNLLEALTVQDVEYVHTYTEGIEMTLADLILFVYFYCLLEALDFNSSNLGHYVPAIMSWLTHMSTLSTIVGVSESLGWEVGRLVTHPSTAGADEMFVLAVESTSAVDDDEMELSRCAKMKHRALKSDIADILTKLKDSNVTPLRGDHPCGDQVHLNWSCLPADVHPKEGDVPESRMFRKCEQLENLATAVQALAKPGDILIDFCSGGGHLGILMAYLLQECNVFLVENKEESLLKACSRITSLGLQNVTLYQCNLDYFIGKFDVGTSLHACGSATDMVLQLCQDAQASFVVCPCCYGSIQKTHLMSYPRSQLFIQHAVTYKEYLTLGHAADQTEHNITIKERGHLCMDLIDTDRLQYAQQMGYVVTLTSLQPLSCTPKNNLLIGKPND